jgi:predicted lipid carrier protein YhbT
MVVALADVVVAVVDEFVTVALEPEEDCMVVATEVKFVLVEDIAVEFLLVEVAEVEFTLGETVEADCILVGNNVDWLLVVTRKEVKKTVGNDVGADSIVGELISCGVIDWVIGCVID